MFDGRVSGRGSRIVDHEGPEHEPGDGRGYRLLRAFRFAGETENTVAAPDTPAFVVLADVPRGAEFHAQAADSALFPVHAEQPREHLPDKKATREQTFQAIDEDRRRIVLCF